MRVAPAYLVIFRMKVAVAVVVVIAIDICVVRPLQALIVAWWRCGAGSVGDS